MVRKSCVWPLGTAVLCGRAQAHGKALTHSTSSHKHSCWKQSQVGSLADRVLRLPDPATLKGRQALQQQLFVTALFQIHEVEVLTQKPKMKSTPLLCQVHIFLIIQHLTGMTAKIK